ncbi:MAG: carbohydrate ABC transporter permease [Caldilineaceae bacterium]|nr:carbohydrate ABC transporter permease [Caldilineaceae bacterium]MBP8108174.1 carbohydrate ABC transporter permease [Caldilineaceae bacterium]MBP9072876.1 carbohydrate ABC transporter permease [Caldilineaceae bacterium]
MNKSANLQRTAKTALLYLILIAAATVMIFPLYTGIVTSLLGPENVSSYPPKLFPVDFRWQNYLDAARQAPLLRFILNSFIQSGGVMVAQLVLASTAAFAFAFLPFKGKQLVFFLFLSTMMIPWESVIIPNYLFIQSIGWDDTYAGLIAPFMATAFGTFLLRQYFMSLPKDLYDAAIVDGCSNLRYLLTIVLPLARPALGTLAVYSFLQTYNQYLWPLLITNSTEMRTVQIGITMLKQFETEQWQIVLAGVVTIMIPTLMLFIFANRQLIRGLTAGALKG